MAPYPGWVWRATGEGATVGTPGGWASIDGIRFLENIAVGAMNAAQPILATGPGATEPGATGPGTPRGDRDRFVALAFCWADLLLELDKTERVVFAAQLRHDDAKVVSELAGERRHQIEAAR